MSKIPNCAAGREVRSVIKVLNAKNMRPSEIYREIPTMYSSVFDESSMHHWPSEITDDLIQSVRHPLYSQALAPSNSLFSKAQSISGWE